jgi:capsular exopolysaccharide synthesis family protein
MSSDNLVEKQIVKKEEIIDIEYYFGLLYEKKWYIIACALVFMVLGAFIALNQKSIYRASTTILIEADGSSLNLVGNNTLSNSVNNRKYFETQFKILESRELSTKLVRRMNLDTHPLYDPRQAPEKFDPIKTLRAFLKSVTKKEEKVGEAGEDVFFNQTVDYIHKGLSIVPIPDTQLVQILFDSYDRNLAAKISDTYADVYIENHLQSKMDATKRAAEWLNGQLEEIRGNLRNSEDALQSFREKNEIVYIEGKSSIDTDELSLLTEQYIEAKNQRYEAEVVFNQLNSLGAKPTLTQLMGLPIVLNDLLVQRFKSSQAVAEQKVAELSTSYGPRHPEMLRVTSELNSVKSALRKQINQVVNGIRTTYNQALETERLLDIQIQKSKKRFQEINRQGFELKELERQVETDRQLFELFFNRSKQTAQANSLQSAHARIVDPATVPRLPISPKRTKMVLIALFLGGFVATAIIFLLDALDKSVRDAEELEENLGINVIAKIPLDIKNTSKTPYGGVLSKNHSPMFKESKRTLRTAFVFLDLDNPYRTTMITSSVPNEGKSSVAINLADSLSEMEKTLLIDGDFRRPSLHSMFDVSAEEPGASDFIAGEKTFPECVHAISESLDLMTAGTNLSSPMELIAKGKTKELFEQINANYERVIIDTAPINAVSDSILLSEFCDCVLYVVRANKTNMSVVSKGVKNLNRAKVNIKGMILNGVDAKSQEYYDAYNAYVES